MIKDNELHNLVLHDILSHVACRQVLLSPEQERELDNILQQAVKDFTHSTYVVEQHAGVMLWEILNGAPYSHDKTFYRIIRMLRAPTRSWYVALQKIIKL